MAQEIQGFDPEPVTKRLADTRLPWITPAVREMRAGLAESGGSLSGDGPGGLS